MSVRKIPIDDTAAPVRATPRRVARSIEDWSAAALALATRAISIDVFLVDEHKRWHTLINELVSIGQRAGAMAALVLVGDEPLAERYVDVAAGRGVQPVIDVIEARGESLTAEGAESAERKAEKAGVITDRAEINPKTAGNITEPVGNITEPAEIIPPAHIERRLDIPERDPARPWATVPVASLKLPRRILRDLARDGVKTAGDVEARLGDGTWYASSEDDRRRVRAALDELIAETEARAAAKGLPTAAEPGCHVNGKHDADAMLAALGTQPAEDRPSWHDTPIDRTIGYGNKALRRLTKAGIRTLGEFQAARTEHGSIWAACNARKVKMAADEGLALQEQVDAKIAAVEAEHAFRMRIRGGTETVNLPDESWRDEPLDVLALDLMEIEDAGDSDYQTLGELADGFASAGFREFGGMKAGAKLRAALDDWWLAKGGRGYPPWEGEDNCPADRQRIDTLIDWLHRKRAGDDAPEWGRWSEFWVKLPDGQVVAVTHDEFAPCNSRTRSGMHLEFEGPVSETGYRSWFVNGDEADGVDPNQASLYDYAKAVAVHLARQLASKKTAADRRKKVDRPASTRRAPAPKPARPDAKPAGHVVDDPDLRAPAAAAAAPPADDVGEYAFSDEQLEARAIEGDGAAREALRKRRREEIAKELPRDRRGLMDDPTVDDYGVFMRHEKVIVPLPKSAKGCSAEVFLARGNDELWYEGVRWKCPNDEGGYLPSVTTSSQHRTRLALFENAGDMLRAAFKANRCVAAANAVEAFLSAKRLAAAAAEVASLKELEPDVAAAIGDWREVSIEDLELDDAARLTAEAVGIRAAGELHDYLASGDWADKDSEWKRACLASLAKVNPATADEPKRGSAYACDPDGPPRPKRGRKPEPDGHDPDLNQRVLGQDGTWLRCLKCQGDYDAPAPPKRGFACHKPRVFVLAERPCPAKNWDRAPVADLGNLGIGKALVAALEGAGFTTVGDVCQTFTAHATVEGFDDFDRDDILEAIIAFKARAVDVADDQVETAPDGGKPRRAPSLAKAAGKAVARG